MTPDLIAYVRERGDGVVSTLGSAGGPQSAYLPIAVTDAGELVFDARVDSRKVANIQRDPRVAVVVGGADGLTLQLEGAADLPTGEDRDRCAAAYTAAFPQFAASLAQPHIALVRVTVTWSLLGDYRELA